MPPQYRPLPATGKRPPLVLPRGLANCAAVGDGSEWPAQLAMPTDAGLLDLCGLWHGDNAANDAYPPAYDEALL